jgi:hypothetical protein
MRRVEEEGLLKMASSLRIRRFAGLKSAGDSNALFLLDLKGDFVGRLGLEGRNRSKGRSFNGPGRRILVIEQVGFVEISWRIVVVVVARRKQWGKKSYNGVNKESKGAALPSPTVTVT